MALTPETLPRHELNGLRVEVVDAPNPDLVGIAGRIVVETMQTFHVEDRVDGESRVRQVPKRGSTFEFVLTDEAAASARTAGTASEPEGASGHPDGASGHPGDDVAHVTVDGARLLSRPALRTEDTGDSIWR
ncbi:ribonuclease P protein component 1 [Halostella sp. JP-L12]|uniref:ribonuclease P protein component 1 n=1 Tax=Halostella TaxID=1843185 RepID=UPI000EF7F23A|nr:ribonuclease P protein component 1 [Halostella sp. JP-L12]